jgi:hypothetical protein
VAVEDRFVRDLAAIVDRPLANKLERALLFRAKFVGLTCDERLAILGALEMAPPELQEVRELLLTDETWRLHQPR